MYYSHLSDSASFISIMRNKLHTTSFLANFIICMIGLFIIYTIGCIYMYGILNFYMGAAKNMFSVIAMGAIPFMISDTCSIAVGCFCALRLAHIPAIKQTLCPTK